MKSGPRRVFRYCITHEKEMPDGSIRRRMELHRTPHARPRKGDYGVGSREWAKEGVAVDWRKLMPPEGFVVLPRRWVVERTIAWIDQQRTMNLWTTRAYVRAGRLWCTLP